jgi:hypothetical protein
MDEIMRKKFKDMLLEKKDTPEGMAVILSMAAMLEGDPRFESLAELYDGIEEYHNFMTEKEARSVVDKIVMFDGSRGAKWNMDIIAEEVKKVGGVLAGLKVEGKNVCTCLDKAVSISLGRIDHKVNVEDNVRLGTKRLDYG